MSPKWCTRAINRCYWAFYKFHLKYDSRKQYSEYIRSWVWDQTNRNVTPNAAISYLCDFRQFSYLLWESASTCVKAMGWILWETGHRNQSESWTVAGLRNRWNQGGSGHLGCRNDGLLRMVPLQLCSSSHARPCVTRNRQESDSQSRPSVWPSLGLFPGAGEVFCLTALPELHAMGKSRYPKRIWLGIEA